LSGLRVLVGRARHQASALSSGLKTLGAEVIEIPFIEIRKPQSYKPLDAALKKLNQYDWLILTSVNGVDALADRTKKLRLNSSPFRNLQIAAIGPATRSRIESLGFNVALVPKRYIAESIVQSLRHRVEGKRVLLVRAKVARDVIPRELRKMGAKLDVVEAYETIVPPSSQKSLQDLLIDPKRRPHIVCFTSSSTVRNFVALLGGRRRSPLTTLNDIKFASIGPITSSTLREFSLPVDFEAEEYTIRGLVQAILGNKTLSGTLNTDDSITML
jgi:uroporphyrinogen-III synthase